MASIDKLVRIILTLDDKMSGGLGKAGSSLTALGGKIAGAGLALTGLTAPLLVAGKAGVALAKDLDVAMRNIQSITNQTDEEIAGLSDRLVDMSTDMSKTVDSAETLAEALYTINSAGFAGEDGMKVLEVATKAAAAGLTETTVAAEGIDAVLNAYNLTADEAAQVSDLMFTTVQRGVGTFEGLASSMSNVVGTANAAGIEFDTVSAAMTTMSKSGMSFKEASVALNQTMLAFIKPSEGMAKAINDLGYESGLALIEQEGLAGALEMVSDSVGGSADQMANLFGNVRALRGALSLTGSNAEKFANDLAAMGDSAGATAQAFEQQMKSFDAAWKNFRNTLDALLIEIGQTLMPILAAIMRFVSGLINAFLGLPEPVRKVIIVIGAIIAVIGPLLLIIGGLISAVGTIGTALGALGAIIPAVTAGFAAISAAVPAIGTALTLLTGPVGIAIALIAGLVIAWKKDFLGIRTAVKGLGDAVQRDMKTMAEGSKPWFAILGDNLKMLGEIIVRVGGKIITGAFNIGKNIVTGIIQGIASMVAPAVNAIGDLAVGIVGRLRNVFQIGSPSKVMMMAGAQVGQGFNIGLAQSLSKAPQIMAQASQGVVRSVNRGVQQTRRMSQSSSRSGKVLSTNNRFLNMTGTSRMSDAAKAAAASAGNRFKLNQLSVGERIPAVSSRQQRQARGGDVNIQNMNVPPGTTREQAQAIMREIGRETKRRGASGIR